MLQFGRSWIFIFLALFRLVCFFFLNHLYVIHCLFANPVFVLDLFGVHKWNEYFTEKISGLSITSYVNIQFCIKYPRWSVSITYRNVSVHLKNTLLNTQILCNVIWKLLCHSMYFAQLNDKFFQSHCFHFFM